MEDSLESESSVDDSESSVEQEMSRLRGAGCLGCRERLVALVTSFPLEGGSLEVPFSFEPLASFGLASELVGFPLASCLELLAGS